VDFGKGAVLSCAAILPGKVCHSIIATFKHAIRLKLLPLNTEVACDDIVRLPLSFAISCSTVGPENHARPARERRED